MNIAKRAIYRAGAALGYHIGLRPPTADSLMGHLALLFDHLEINCVLDVGACRGEFAQRLRAQGFSGRIVSWEPVAENLRILRAQSEADRQWIVHDYALGSTETLQEMQLTNQSSLHSFLRANDYGQIHFGSQLEVTEVRPVPVRRLDQVLDQCLSGLERPRVFLKTDTQGYDLQVIQGARHCLDRVLCLQCEAAVHPIYQGVPDYVELIGELRELGFELSGLFPVTIDRRMWLVEIDCVMVKRDL